MTKSLQTISSYHSLAWSTEPLKDQIGLQVICRSAIGTNQLSASPTLPDLAQHNHLVALVQQMLDLHRRAAAEANPQMKTMLQRQITAADGQIDRVVYQLYDLSNEEIAIIEAE